MKKNKDKIIVKIINKITQKVITMSKRTKCKSVAIKEVYYGTKICRNCKFSFIINDRLMQCYHPNTDYFFKPLNPPCDLWEKI